MKGKGFNPQRIFWIAALLTLILGMFFFGVQMDYIYGHTYFPFKIVHAAAITSGILSMISFGYAYLMKGAWSRVWSLVHTLLTIGIAVAIIYLNFTYNADPITAEAAVIEAKAIDDWRSVNIASAQAMDYKLALTLIWFALQMVFFAWFLVIKSRRN